MVGLDIGELKGERTMAVDILLSSGGIHVEKTGLEAWVGGKSASIYCALTWWAVDSRYVAELRSEKLYQVSADRSYPLQRPQCLYEIRLPSLRAPAVMMNPMRLLHL